MSTREEHDKFLVKYRKEYEKFGEDRKQEGVPDLPRQPKKWKKGQVNDWSAFDTYWANRLDQRNGAWTKMPGYSKYVHMLASQ